MLRGKNKSGWTRRSCLVACPVPPEAIKGKTMGTTPTLPTDSFNLPGFRLYRAGRDHNDLERKTRLIPTLRAGTFRLEKTCGELFEEIALARWRRRRPVYRQHVEVLVINLFTAWCSPGNPFLVFSLDRRSYEKGSYLQTNGLERDIMSGVVDRLHECGLIEVVAHFHTETLSRRRRYRASEELIKRLHGAGTTPCDVVNDKKTVILRKRPVWITPTKNNGKRGDPYKKKGDEIDCSRGPLAKSRKSFEADVERINCFLREIDIEARLTEQEFIQTFTASKFQEGKAPNLPNVALRTLQRIFARKFDFDGRLYGHWVQGLPKGIRPHIHLNGFPTVELDYKNLHPRLLYNIEKATPPETIYRLPGYDSSLRKHFKRLMAMALNADTEQKAINAARKAFRDNPAFKQVEPNCCKDSWLKPALAALKDHHWPIAKYFGTEAALWLMRIDGNMAVHIMLRMVSSRIPCIPVFDSFIVPHHEEQNLAAVMVEAAIKHSGREIPMSRESEGGLSDALSPCITDSSGVPLLG